MSPANEAEEKNRIFRQASLDRIASAEQTDDYLRVPSVNVLLVMIVVLLLAIGAAAWFILGA